MKNYKIVNKVRFTIAVIIMAVIVMTLMVWITGLADTHSSQAIDSLNATGNIRAFDCEVIHDRAGNILLDDGLNYYSIEGYGFDDGTQVRVYIADNNTQTIFDDVVIRVDAI